MNYGMNYNNYCNPTAMNGFGGTNEGNEYDYQNNAPIQGFGQFGAIGSERRLAATRSVAFGFQPTFQVLVQSATVPPSLNVDAPVFAPRQTVESRPMVESTQRVAPNPMVPPIPIVPPFPMLPPPIVPPQMVAPPMVPPPMVAPFQMLASRPIFVPIPEERVRPYALGGHWKKFLDIPWSEGAEWKLNWVIAKRHLPTPHDRLRALFDPKTRRSGARLDFPDLQDYFRGYRYLTEEEKQIRLYLKGDQVFPDPKTGKIFPGSYTQFEICKICQSHGWAVPMWKISCPLNSLNGERRNPGRGNPLGAAGGI